MAGFRLPRPRRSLTMGRVDPRKIGDGPRTLPIPNANAGVKRGVVGQATLQTLLPKAGHYGAPSIGVGVNGAPEGQTLAIQGFEIKRPQVFGDLPLKERRDLAIYVALKAARHGGQEATRLQIWRDGYAGHLVESSLVQAGDQTTLEGRALSPFPNQKGTRNLGIFRVEHSDGPRIVKLLPQTGFHDLLLGNLLAEALGGPRIHRFGRLEVQGGTDRLEGYKVAMFIEMEELHPGTAMGRLKEQMKAHLTGQPTQLGVPILVQGLARLFVDGMLNNVAPTDPDLLFGADGRGRPLDGDVYHQVFDLEEIVAVARQTLREHGWEHLEASLLQAMKAAIPEATDDPRQRRRLADALLTF